jgi:hypothetical protein
MMVRPLSSVVSVTPGGSDGILKLQSVVLAGALDFQRLAAVTGDD